MARYPLRWFMLLLISMFISNSFGCGGGDQESQQAQSEVEKSSQNEATAQKSELDEGDVEKGKPLYIQSCSACHGQDAKGLEGLGKDLVQSEFVAKQTDQELLQYVLEGRSVDDSLNTTGIAMPPKGGNPALTEQQIMHIIAYMRQLQQEAEPKKSE